MRVLYIAPRYHTNQTAIVEGWLQHGDEVFFLSRKKATNEDYSALTPDLIPYAKSFELFEKIYSFLCHSETAHDIGLKLGYPSARAIRKYIKNRHPDFVILREKSVYSIVCYHILKRMGIKTIMYNQTPLYQEAPRYDRNLIHRIVDRLTPEFRFTPVRKIGDYAKAVIKDPHGIFVPFVMRLHCSPEEKHYFKDGTINVIDVGRFERRKNHHLLLQAFEKVYHEDHRVRLTIIGEIRRSQYQTYYDEIITFIREHFLTDVVTIKKNLRFEEMDAEYRAADVFVIPSTGEPAAISPLEAMSYSVPAISSSGNGTADYIIDGVSGAIFKDKDMEDLTVKLRWIVRNAQQIPKMGQKAYENIADNYQFANYYEALMKWYVTG